MPNAATYRLLGRIPEGVAGPRGCHTIVASVPLSMKSRLCRVSISDTVSSHLAHAVAVMLVVQNSNGRCW